MKPIQINQKGRLATWILHEKRHNKFRLLVTETKADEVFGIERPEIFRDAEMRLIDPGSGNGHPAMKLPGYEALIAETNAEICKRLTAIANIDEQPDLPTRLAERDTLIQSLYEEVDALKGDKEALEKRVARLVEDVTHGKQREKELEAKVAELRALACSGEAFREQVWSEVDSVSSATNGTGFDAAAEEFERIAEDAQPTTSGVSPIVDAEPEDEAPAKPKKAVVARQSITEVPFIPTDEEPPHVSPASFGWSWPFSWADALEVIRLTVAGATTVGIVRDLGINTATIQSIRTAFQPEINSLKKRNSSEQAEYLARMKADFQKRAGVKAA